MSQMIAQDFNGFVEKVSEGIRTALNTPTGQQITKELLRMKLEENPELTPEEWKETKSQFMTFCFTLFVKETPQAMKELSCHVWNELQRGAQDDH